MSGSSASFSLFQLIHLLGGFFKALIGKANDVQDAMAKLDHLSTQEGQVVMAITLVTIKQMSLDLVPCIMKKCFVS